MDAKLIGSFLLELRKEKSMTQKEIAKLCSVSTQAVSKWERGESIPDIELLDRLSKLYSLSINEIIDGERHEVYVDENRKLNIILITLSLLVFISYIFNYAEVRDCYGCISWSSVVLRGYELILNGIGGWQVYLAWIVFVLLLTNLIINIFVHLKVLNRTGRLFWLSISAYTIIVFVSIFGIISELHFLFPQFIFFVCSLISIFLLFNLGDATLGIRRVKEYMKNRRNDSIPSNQFLDLTEKNKKLLYRIKLVTYTVLVLLLILFISSLFSFVQGLITDYVSVFRKQELFFTSYMTIAGLVNIYMIRFFSSVYTKQSLYWMSTISLSNVIGISALVSFQSGNEPILFIISFIPSLIYFITAFKIPKTKIN